MAKRWGVLLAALGCCCMAAQDKDKEKTKEIKVEYAEGKTATLKYQDLKEGNGDEAKKGSDITVHYTGWLTDGKKFDSSVGGQPFTLKLGNGEVIKGWDAGIVGMKVGGKRKLTIPPELAYGARGTPDGTIPPNATLVFEVELLKVK
jgi:FKBP-type peptidyl-prolyl cis-trans isomerase